jgi:hypothetical protein
MNRKYGEGGWNRRTEQGLFDRLKKHYGAHYQDPKEMPGSYDGPHGIPGGDREVSIPSPEENGSMQSVVA